MQERRMMTMKDKLTLVLSVIAILTSVTVALVGWVRADQATLSAAQHGVIEASIKEETKVRENADTALEKTLDKMQSTLNSVKKSTDETRGMVQTLLEFIDGKLISGR